MRFGAEGVLTNRVPHTFSGEHLHGAIASNSVACVKPVP